MYNGVLIYKCIGNFGRIKEIRGCDGKKATIIERIWSCEPRNPPHPLVAMNEY